MVDNTNSQDADFSDMTKVHLLVTASYQLFLGSVLDPMRQISYAAMRIQMHVFYYEGTFLCIRKPEAALESEMGLKNCHVFVRRDGQN